MSLDLEIQCEAPKQRYTSGDVISGVIMLNINTEIKIERLEICCQCTSEAEISQGTANYKTTKQHYLKRSDIDLNRIFRVGSYEFPFTFTLPSSPDLPETYSSGHVTLNSARESKSGSGNVVWEIIASVPRFKIFDISMVTSQQFWFIPRRQEPTYEGQREFSFSPKAIKLGQSMFTKERAPHVYVRAAVPESGIAQDPQPSGIELKLYSDIERAVFVRELSVFLEASTTFNVRGHTFCDVSKTNILHLTPNLPLSLDPIDLTMCMSTSEFKLPVVFYGTFKTSLIELNYNLVIEAQIGSFKDRKCKAHTVSLPVTVKPIRSVPSPSNVQPGVNTSLDEFNFRDSGFDEEEFDFETPAEAAKSDRLNHSFSSSSLDELWEPEFEDEIAQLFKERRPYTRERVA